MVQKNQLDPFSCDLKCDRQIDKQTYQTAAPYIALVLSS